MPFLRRTTSPPPTLPVYNDTPRATSVFDRVFTYTSELRGTIFAEQDEWKKQCRKIKNVKYSASEHNKPFTEVLTERAEEDCPEISTVMNLHPSIRGGYETLCVEAFCKGAELVLLGIHPSQAQGSQLAEVQEPKAWVSDRNYWLLKDGASDTSFYGNVLDRVKFYEVLQIEVMY